GGGGGGGDGDGGDAPGGRDPGWTGDALDPEGQPAGTRAGDRGGETDDGGAQEQWPELTDARRSRSGSTSRPSANASPPRSTTCAQGWTSTRSCRTSCPSQR